jgi:tRNA(Arg) A34 adenosine deaminase TadA
MTTKLGFDFELPDWVHEAVDFTESYPSDEEKMAVAVNLARTNIEKHTGGPFGAAVFDLETGRLLGPGINRVVPTNNPTAHAEMVAISVAANRIESYNLGVNGPVALVTSVEPCAMCLGATPWSGASRVIIGARDHDARSIGFDEGDKPTEWKALLEGRGISVACDVLRDESVAVLKDYQLSNKEIYNT